MLYLESLEMPAVTDAPSRSILSGAQVGTINKTYQSLQLRRDIDSLAYMFAEATLAWRSESPLSIKKTTLPTLRCSRRSEPGKVFWGQIVDQRHDEADMEGCVGEKSDGNIENRKEESRGYGIRNSLGLLWPDH